MPCSRTLQLAELYGTKDLAIQSPVPEVINFFSCSAQLRLKFIPLINVKLPTIVLINVKMSTIVGILTLAG